jgi:hypothetical protein
MPAFHHNQDSHEIRPDFRRPLVQQYANTNAFQMKDDYACR